MDGGRHAEERRRQAAPPGRHASSRWRSACPATATSTSSGSRRRSRPAEVEPFTEADFAANPSLVKGYIGPGALGTDGTSGIRFLVDPRVVDGTRWVTGANAPGHHVIDLVAGRDFTADGMIDAAEVATATPARVCGVAARDRPRHRDRPHLPARPHVRRGARPDGARTRTGKQVTVTMGSYGIGVSRAVAAIAEATHDELGPVLAARGRARRRPHRRRRQGRRPAAARRPSGSPTELEAAGVRVLLDDRERRLARRQVQGRRADRRARRSSSSAAASPTIRRRARSRSRTAAPAPAPTSPSPRSSPTSPNCLLETQPRAV